MEKPRIAAKQPEVLTLEQPFCDGAHQGTGIEPVEFTVDETKEIALCMCKQTKTPPFCDGTHETL
jgi:CDGSH iron-sulfur domain-containing protein 3